jgi:polygalacturonase
MIFMEKLYEALYGDGIHDDTGAFQALLDNTEGKIEIPDGIYLISKPLKIHDNTNLSLSNKAVMRLADRANCAILENDRLSERGTNRNITINGGIWDGNNENQVRRSVAEAPTWCRKEVILLNSRKARWFFFIFS